MRVLICPIAQRLYLLLLLITPGTFVPAQTPDLVTATDTAEAIELYRQGDTNLALTKLNTIVKKRPADADAWDTFAKVLYRERMFLQARTALERLVSLRPKAAEAHARLAYAMILGDDRVKAIAAAERALELGHQSPEGHYAIAEANLRDGAFAKSIAEADLALALAPEFLPALITKSLAHSSLMQYPEAAVSLERFLALSPNEIDAEAWRSQLEELSLRAVESQSSHAIEPLILTGKQVTEKARVLYKPEPQYTEPARLAGVTGTVVLRGIISHEGELKRIFVSRGLSYGLTTRAIRAARLIKFVPATKDGRPVSMFIQLEYNFNLY